MTHSTLAFVQKRFGDDIDREIQSWLARGLGSKELADMLAYQLGYVERPPRERSTGGGKRFRPALCLLACEAVSGAWEEALSLAAAIELLHNFSLIHDDIEDGDPVRRHRPTVWKVWGQPQAINVGDAMFALASRAVLCTHVDHRIAQEVAAAFQETTLALTVGQYLDMSFEDRQDVAVVEYTEMITGKSAELIAFSLWSGARVGGGPAGACERLREFGRELGRAFQIQDDIMGIWGSVDQTGKEPAKDLRNRKKTLPSLLALEQSDDTGRRLLNAFFRREEDDVDVVIRLLDNLNTREQTERAVESYRARALQALHDSGIHGEPAAILEALAQELTVER
jgi:geranylgeranyl diphosphate synthase type I